VRKYLYVYLNITMQVQQIMTANTLSLLELNVPNIIWHTCKLLSVYFLGGNKCYPHARFKIVVVNK
jgi:hypothetical protein